MYRGLPLIVYDRERQFPRPAAVYHPPALPHSSFRRAASAAH